MSQKTWDHYGALSLGYSDQQPLSEVGFSFALMSSTLGERALQPSSECWGGGNRAVFITKERWSWQRKQQSIKNAKEGGRRERKSKERHALFKRAEFLIQGLWQQATILWFFGYKRNALRCTFAIYLGLAKQIIETTPIPPQNLTKCILLWKDQLSAPDS